MKEIATSELKAGMVTTAPVKTKRGQELIPARTTLTRQLISRMEFYSVPFACIDESSILSESDMNAALDFLSEGPIIFSEDEIETLPDIEPIAPPADAVAPTRSAPIKDSPVFQKYFLDFSFAITTLQLQLEALAKEGKEPDYDELQRSVASLITPGQTIIQYFDMLHHMRSIDDSVYSHSLNVAMISRIIGKWLKWTTEDLDALVIAALLHDVGKVLIPPEILNKKEKLTAEEFEQVRWHPRAGYDLVKDLPIDSRIKKAVLQHHERCDGSGYPMKLDEVLIDDFAMVIAIADVYDAMTAARAYRAPLSPFQVIYEFERDGFHKYKTEFLLTFLNRIASTYMNNRVILSDGRAAKIIYLNQNCLSDPLVQLDDGSCLDLSKSKLYIQAII